MKYYLFCKYDPSFTHVTCVLTSEGVGIVKRDTFLKYAQALPGGVLAAIAMVSIAARLSSRRNFA